MTDQDYIEKAARLADGWGLELDNDGEYLVGPDMGWHQDCISQGAKDALAAQLVRQVDALRNPHVGVITSDLGSITIWCNRQILAASINEDRTMNTIKAIIDSGVLE